MQNDRHTAWERSGETENERHTAWEGVLHPDGPDGSRKMGATKMAQISIFVCFLTFFRCHEKWMGAEITPSTLSATLHGNAI